jgi:hypothetical protein
MRHNTDNNVFALTRLLSTINKSVRNNKAKPFVFKGVNLHSAEALYHSLRYQQKNLLKQIGTSINASSEYFLADVLVFSVLRWYNTDEQWIFDEDDYTRLKNNFKIISTEFRKTNYIDTIKKLQEDLQSGNFKAKDLVTISHDGTSVLYKMYATGSWTLPVIIELMDLYSLVDITDESPQHIKFRKMLMLVSGIRDQHKKNKSFY